MGCLIPGFATLPSMNLFQFDYCNSALRALWTISARHLDALKVTKRTTHLSPPPVDGSSQTLRREPWISGSQGEDNRRGKPTQ